MMRRKHVLLATVALLWLGTTALGMGLLAQYGSTSGRAALAPPQWPAASVLTPAADVPTLVLLAHPRCPCTRASLHELARVAARVPGRLRTHVLFYLPEGRDAAWARQDLWRLAQTLPDATLHLDPQGREAARFGAYTSGQVLVYQPEDDARLVLRFNGGVTAARGHEGTNDGATSVLALARTGQAPLATTPVYGCALGSPDAEAVSLTQP